MLSSRYIPGFHAVWSAVQDGAVGEPLLINALKSYKLGTRHPMYTHRATYGGTIPWVAIHGIDWIHWITGGAITDVSACHTTRGNGGHGIFVHDSSGNGLANPLEIEQNTTRSNGLHGIFIAGTATGHELKGNVSGGTGDLDNGDCEFLSVAAGNWNATGNKANGITIPGRDGDPFPTGCLGTP